MIYFALAAGIFALDDRIKRKVERPFGKDIVIQKPVETGREKKILWNTIILRKHHNKGACLNFMDHRQAFIAVLSAVLTVFLGVFLALLPKGRQDAPLKTGIAFMLGGALSNTFDRLIRKYVVDYFSFNTRWLRLKKIVFNISDLFIMAGAAIAVLFRK